MRSSSLFLILFTCIAFFSCEQIHIYEKKEGFSKLQWKQSNKVKLEVQLNDSAAYYNVYFLLRHADAYHYNNIWVNITTLFPGEASKTQRLNLVLANNIQGWLGAAFDDIIEHRVLLNNKPVLLPSGKYTFILQHIMREDPLENVSHAGIRIERVEQ